MKTGRTVLRLALIAMLLTFGLAQTVAAQVQDFEPDFYSSSLAGVDIEVSGPEYQIVQAELQHYSSGEGEVVEIEPESGLSSAEVSFYDDSDTPEESVNIYLTSMENAADTFTLLQEGQVGDWYTSLALIDYQGVEILYYVQVQEDVSGNVDQFEGFLSPAEDFTGLLVTAQEEISIDGVGFMENADAEALAALMEGGGLSTPVTDEETVPSAVEPTDTMVLPASGAEVGVGPDFAFSSDVLTFDGIEGVQLSGSGSGSIVGVGDTGNTPAEMLDQFQAGLTSEMPDSEVIYEDADDQLAWRVLWVSQSDGSEMFVLISADTTTVPGFELLTAHELPADDVNGTVLDIQEQVSVNGTPVLSGIDADDIDSITGDFLQVDGDEEVSTPEADDTEESDEGNPRDGARLTQQGDDEPGDDSDATTEGNTSEVNSTPEPTQESSNGDSGDETQTLTDSSWKGGVYGHLIEWDYPTWYFDESRDGNIYSNFDSGEDTIIIHSDEGDDTAWLFLSVYYGSDASAEDFYDYWLSDEFIADFEDDGSVSNTEVIGSRTRGDGFAVVIRYTASDGSAYIMVREAKVLEDGTVQVVTLDSGSADSSNQYTMALTGVTIDGEAAFTVFSSSQLDRVLED